MSTVAKKTTTPKNPTSQPKIKANDHNPSTHHVIPFADDQELYQIREVPLSQIVIPEGYPTSTIHDDLVESIQNVGLLHPITITKSKQDTYKLVTGRNRLEAYRQLGWTSIPAHVVSFDDKADKKADADTLIKLAQIDEDLIRKNLSALELAEYLLRRKAIYHKLYSQKKRGGAPGKAGGGKAKTPDSGNFVPSFLQDTAQKTGKGQSTIAETVQIAESIPDDIRDQLRATPIEDRKTDLLTLARMSPEKQQTVANAIVSQGHQTVGEALQVMRETQPTKKKSLYDSGVGLMGFLENVKDYAYQYMSRFEEHDILSHNFQRQGDKVVLVIELKHE